MKAVPGKVYRKRGEARATLLLAMVMCLIGLFLGSLEIMFFSVWLILAAIYMLLDAWLPCGEE